MRIPLFRAVELLIVLVIALFIIGNFTFLAGEENEKKTSDKKEVLGDSSDISPTEAPSPAEEDAETNNVQVTIKKENPTNTPAPDTNSSAGNSDFVYPGATATGGSTYESSDDPDAITNWYKDKIIAANMNVKTFVTTKTNGNVLNKLAGANSSVSIEIEIEKKEGNPTTKITIKK